MSGKINYSKLTFLIADDFGSFRNTVNSMLSSLGATNVVMAATAQEVFLQCQSRKFDVILCDYNLGAGRTGQHVLEELRHKHAISRDTIFIIVSAESSRTIVMCSYDCEPDDYLMKPITAKMLEQRINRLLKQRGIFSTAYAAIEKQDYLTASDILIDLSMAEDRYSNFAQKLLGTVFIRMGDLDKAERLYTRALEVRQVDWARLGLAVVKQARGDLELAGDWLEKIVADNPLYLPAYDAMATNWDKKGEKFNVQFTVQRAVDISPMSILRQKYLAEVATENNDLITALSAQRRSVKLGQYSCHGRAEDHFGFARISSLAVEREMDVDTNISNEALAILDKAKEQYDLNDVQLAQCSLLTGRIHALERREDMAQSFFAAAEQILENVESNIDLDVDRVLALQSLGDKKKVTELLEELQTVYADDQEALEKLDVFLDEPASDSSREFVATINREGIELYNDARFDEALSCFEKARKLFPKHVGIQLNMVQSLIGKMKDDISDDSVKRDCRDCLNLVESLIDDEHPQYDRYRRLRNMANSI